VAGTSHSFDLIGALDGAGEFHHLLSALESNTCRFESAVATQGALVDCDRGVLTRDDRAGLAVLRKDNARLRMERDLLKRATAVWVKDSGLRTAICGSLRGPPRDSRTQRRARSPKSHARRTDDWRVKQATPPTDAEVADTELVAAMREIHVESESTYDQLRMTPELRDRGFCVNHKRVERLTGLHDIVGVHKPAKAKTTIPAEDNVAMPDLIGRPFAPGAPDVG